MQQDPNHPSKFQVANFIPVRRHADTQMYVIDAKTPEIWVATKRVRWIQAIGDVGYLVHW